MMGQTAKKHPLLLFFTVLVALIFYSVSPVHADAQDINISISAGFDGKCRMGGINPVTVTLETKEKGFQGMLNLEADGKKYSHKVQLAKDAKKSFRFSIPFLNANAKISASCESGGKTSANIITTPIILPENSVFVGILSDTPENFKYAEEMDFCSFGSKKKLTADLGKNFEYTREQLDCFNFILLDNFDMSNLSDESRKDLKDWIRSGNCMLVGAGKYAYKNLKGDFKNMNSPQNIGEGMIVPVKEGLENAAPEYIEGMLEKYITSYGIAKIVAGSGLPQQMRNAERLYSTVDGQLRPASNILFFLLALLALYLCAAGISVYMGKKRKWLFTVVIAGFCVVFYITALWGGIQEPSAAAAAVKIYGNSSGTRTYALVGTYPRGEEKVSLKLPGASFVYACGENQGVDDPLGKEAVFSGKGSHYAYSSSLEPHEDFRFALNLAEGDVLTGKIKNPLPYRLHNCFLILGDTVIGLGELGGREEVQVKYRLDHVLKDTGDYNYLDSISRAARMDGWERQLFEYYFYNLEDSAAGGRLFGFAEDRTEAQIDGRRKNIRTAALHVFRADIVPDGGVADLPGEYIKPVAYPGESMDSMEKREALQEKGKELKVYYALPSNIRAQEIKFSGRPEPGAGKLEVFNREKASWLEPDGDTLSGEKLYGCVSKGPLVVRIVDGSRVILPQISLKGIYTGNGEKGTGGG